MSISKEGGFTIVEILVAIVVAVLFIGMILQIYSYTAYQIVLIERQNIAFTIANNNLEKYDNRDTLYKELAGRLTCTDKIEWGKALVIDLTNKSNKEPVPNNFTIDKQFLVVSSGRLCSEALPVDISSYVYYKPHPNSPTVQKVIRRTTVQ